MKKLVQATKQKLGVMRAAVGTGMLAATCNVNAALPTTANPTNAAANGDYIGLLKGYAYDIAIVLGLILGTIAFLSVAKNCIGVYNEIGAGKKTWGDMGMHGGMGVLLLVLVVYLLTEAAGIIF